MPKQTTGTGKKREKRRTYTGLQEQEAFEPLRRGDDIITYAGTVKEDTQKVVRVKDKEQLDRYLRREREGAVATQIRRMNLASPDFATDKYTISKEQVRYSAKRFVYETIDTGGSGFGGAVGSSYSYDYKIENQLIEARESLNESWSSFDVDSLTKFEREQFINTEKAYQARAILETARIGGVKLSEAQTRRLEVAAEGNYLSLLGKKRIDPRKRQHMNAREKAQYLEELRRNDII